MEDTHTNFDSYVDGQKVVGFEGSKLMLEDGTNVEKERCRFLGANEVAGATYYTKDLLLVGEANVGGGMVMTQRGWAAEVLSSVGWATDHGAYPQEISAFDLGRALGRALTNSNESEHLMLLGVEILRGMQHYKNVKEYHPKEVKNG